MRTVWTEDEMRVVAAMYEDYPAAEIAVALERSVSSVYNAVHKLGLRKSTAWIAERARLRSQRPDHGGRRSQFPKGHEPANKGLRRPGWAPGRMAATQFKPGQKGARYMPIGATRLIDGYLYRKVSDVPKVAYTVNWKLEHVLVWEAVNGAIPAGHALVFRDGDKGNVQLDNLELITRAELMRRNTLHNRYPKELCLAIQLNGALKRKLRRVVHAEEQAV